MTTQFENEYYTSDQMISEYVHQVLCKPLKRHGAIFSGLALVMLMLTMKQEGSPFKYIFGVCLIIIISTTLLSPYLTIKQIKDNDRQIHGGQKMLTKTQFGKVIQITEGTFSLTVNYTQIIEIYELKSVYVMMFGKRNGIVIAPDAFTKGDFESFKVFIRKKCKNAVIKSIN